MRMEINMDMNIWWERMMALREQEGRRDAEAGVFDMPYPPNEDPEDQAHNDAYAKGFRDRRKELGDAFKWSA